MTSEEMEAPRSGSNYSGPDVSIGAGYKNDSGGPVKTEIHAMLLIAEAIHRLATAVEKLDQKPKIPVREGAISYSVGGTGGEGPKGSPL